MTVDQVRSVYECSSWNIIWTFSANSAAGWSAPGSLPLKADVPSLRKQSWAESWEGHAWKVKGRGDPFTKDHIKRLSVSSIRSKDNVYLVPKLSKNHWNQRREPPGLQVTSGPCSRSARSSINVNPHPQQDLIQFLFGLLSIQAHCPV